VSEVKPVRAVARAALRAAPQLAPGAKQMLWRSVYEVISLGRRDHGTALLNYGYAPLDSSAAESVRAEGQADSFGLQLYAMVAGAAELSGKDVLEVGCGRGGGAAFVFERFGLRSMTGLDLARQAIERCRARYARPGLEFVAGNAEQLPFPDAAFDAVLSVESTHCYGDPPSFLREAHRVLRPGGLLLLADLRSTKPTQDGVFAREDVARLHEQLADAGFRTLDEEDITPNVVRALELDTPIRRAQIERRVPKLLRRQVLRFAAVEGSPVYRAFAEHELTYLRFVLEKA
jgi:SAM-dependent methyltransferase